jgi:prevent-host-death family protein
VKTKGKKKARVVYPGSGAMMLQEAVALPGLGLTMPVRAAKAKLSALLELVAAGTAVTITSDGKPKAVLRPVESAAEQVGFEPAWDLLEMAPMQTEGPFAEDLIRADRDGRGW